MHTTLSLIAAATTTTTAGSKNSSGSSYGILIIVLLFGAAYFLLIRPRSQRMRQQQAAARQIQVGDEVVTAGGIHGTLVALGDDTAEVEVAPGVVMTFLRRAVNARPGAASQGGGTVEEDAAGLGAGEDHDGSGSEAQGDDHPGTPPHPADHDPGETAGPAS